MTRRGERYYRRLDKAEMEALRKASGNEERIKKASEAFRKFQEQKKAGKLPAWERVGKAQ